VGDDDCDGEATCDPLKLLAGHGDSLSWLPDHWTAEAAGFFPPPALGVNTGV